MFLKKKRIKQILNEDILQKDPTQVLDECVVLYNAFVGKKCSTINPHESIYPLFWKCQEALCYWYKEEKVTIYAGECEFEYLKTLLYSDGPEYAVRIIFTTDNKNFYQIAVCVRGKPMLRKIDIQSKQIRRSLEFLDESGVGIGTYFGDENERRAKALIHKYLFDFEQIPREEIVQLLEKEICDPQEGSGEYIRVLCGYLYCIGDSTDIPLIKKAKYNLNMDVGCMVDYEWITTENIRPRSEIVESFVEYYKTYFSIEDEFFVKFKNIAKEKSVERALAFLSEKERQGEIVLYAGTYSFALAKEKINDHNVARFYIYTTEKRKGYLACVSRIGGICSVRREERIFHFLNRFSYSKKNLSNCFLGEDDYRCGEFFGKSKGHCTIN